MNATIINNLKIAAAVAALAVALFFGYTVVSYVTENVNVADALGCSSCGGGGGIWWFHMDGGGGGGWGGGDGGGGGGGFTPYCTLTVVQGPVQSASYPPINQYILTWNAPLATSFSIDNGIGLVTPPTGGTYNHYSTMTSGTFTGTAVTPYGTVQCFATIVPPAHPPYCALSASPSTITSGGSSTLTWNTTAGTTFTISTIGVVTPTGGGMTSVSPTVTTTYTGTVVGPGGTAQCQTTVTVVPPAECKLEITKSANKTAIGPNESVEYTITVKNAGNATCTGSGVKIQDVLDANLTYVSESRSVNITAGYQSEPLYQSSTRTLSWNAWDLDPGETGWVKIVAKGVTPTACSVVVPNKAKITSFEYGNFTTWVESNVVNVTLAKDCTPPPPTECKLEITKSANKTSVAPNGTVEYTLNVKNAGTATCTGSGVKIQDVLDPMLTFVSETHSWNIDAGYQTEPLYKASTRTLSWNAWDLNPGETGWIKFVVKAETPVHACTLTVPNKAKITSFEYSNFTIWVESNTVNVDIVKDCTPPPTECILEITKSANKTTAAPNDEVEYTLNIKNTGTKTCTGSGVKVQDVLDTRLTYLSETRSSNITAGYQAEPVYQSSTRTLSWNAWDLEPGETGWIKFKAKVGTPTACTESVPNKAKITAFEYANFTVWVESNVVNVSVTKDCYTPVPYCTMSASPTSITSGQSATLSWNSTHVSSVTIDKGIGSVALSGTTSVSPTVTTTYTGTFVGSGGTVVCQATVAVVSPPVFVPQCTLSVSASNIKSGQSVMVSWTSQNVSTGFITSVGTTTPVFGGTAEVFPSSSTTFVGTFTGAYGTTTCSVPVTVQSGPGGCTGNCGGGGINQPNVVLLQKPLEAPLAFVTLDQIPYTGFEAGKALTLAFWLSVGVLAAALTYFVMGQGGINFILGRTFAVAGVGVYDKYQEVDRTLPNQFGGRTVVSNEVDQYEGGFAGTGVYATSVMTAMPTYAPVAPVAVPTPVAAPAPVAVAPEPKRAAVDGIPDMHDVIESRAHAAGVLMSPEAVALALKLSADRGEALRMFGDILNEAVRTLPREDGWVMLTSDRFESFAGTAPAPVTLATATKTPSVEEILNSVMPPVAPKAFEQVKVEMPMAGADDQAVVMGLAQAILGGDREGAYRTVRNLETSGASATTVMTIVASALDQLYRARRHGTTTGLTTAALSVTDETLSKLVEVFTHGMDTAYANPFTGLKLAIAQAFEARG
jgi:uncharacterized repeat protein (TIGR01451 family)